VTRNCYSEQTDGSQQGPRSAISGKNGYLGILPGHAPLITELGVGEISYRENEQSHFLAVAWGFAEVLPDRVTILAETAEHAGEIDVRRAERANKRAEQRPTSGDPNVDCARAQRALTRAATRARNTINITPEDAWGFPISYVLYNCG